MASPNNDVLFSKGMEYYKANDSACIQLFEKSNDDRSRAQLAKIYFEGFSNIKKDYDTALGYTANNNHYLAVSIECEIRVFIRKEEDYYSIAFSKLSEACKKFQNNTHMNILLSRMLFQGIGTEPNYFEACQLVPRLKTRDYFRSQAKYCSDEIKNKLITQIETLISDDPNYYCFVGDLYGLMHNYDKGYDYYLKAIEAGVLAYKSVITHLLKSERPSEALEYADEWYAVDKCSASAAAFADVSIILGRPPSDYIDILDEFKYDPTCLRKEICAAHTNKMDDLYEKLIVYAIQHDVPAYDAVARYFLSTKNYDKAIEYFQRDYDYSIKCDRQHIGESATNLFTCIYDTKGKCDINLVTDISKYGKLQDFHHVGCILISEGSSEFKEYGLKLLESASCKQYDKSTIKLLEIAEKTGDNTSLEKLNSRLQNNTSGRYMFCSNDKTEIIESMYDNLPPSYRLNALVELVKRYYYGNKHNTPKNNELALKYIELYLADTDKELDHRFPMINALKGAIIYKDYSSKENDMLAFQLMYPCRNIFPFLNYVAEAMIIGRGTDVNIDGGIALLKGSRHPYCMKVLSAYYESGKYVDANPDISFAYTKSLILEFDPEEEVIERFIRLADCVGEEPTSIDSKTCMQKKSSFLFYQAINEDDMSLQLRLYDFSRKLGNVKAACKEANIIRREYHHPKLAYSILSEYNNDMVCNALREKYSEQDRVIVDIESNINSIINGVEEIKFLLDGNEMKIMDSYDSSFFTRRFSFKLSQVSTPITIELSELNYISKVLSPNKEKIVDLDIIEVNKLLIPTDEPVVNMVIKNNSTNELLATTSIRCSGSYELIGTNNLVSKTIFETRFHLENSTSKDKTMYRLIEDEIIFINTSGFDKIIIEENRNEVWVQCCIINIPDLKIDPNGEYFIKIYIEKKIIGFQKSCFSGYVDDGPLVERFDSIIETKLRYKNELPKWISTKVYVKEARERIIEYLCQLKGPVLVNRIARINKIDDSFAKDLYLCAKKQGKDVSVAKYLFPSHLR